MNSPKKQRIGTVGACLVLLGLGVTQVAACADNRASLFIRQIILSTDDACTVTNDPSAPSFVPPGLLDVGLNIAGGADYSLPLLVGNQLVRRTDSTKLRSESDYVFLTYADVTVETVDGAIIDEYQVPISGTIDPAVGTDPGYGFVAVPLVSLSTLSNHRQQLVDAGLVVTRVVVGGVTSGDDDVESGDWTMPIQICDGCTCPTGFASECKDAACSSDVSILRAAGCCN